MKVLDFRLSIADFGLRGWLTLLLSLVLLLPAGVAWAHGGGVPRLTNAEAGPYWVSVWTQPDPLRVGEAHITVAVSEPTGASASRREAGPPILDATVRVQFTPLDQAGEPLTAPATHGDAANKLFYEADLELSQTGRWGVLITVEGPDGPGSAGFEALVAPPGGFNWTWLGGLGLVGLAGVWLAQRFRDKKSNAD